MNFNRSKDEVITRANIKACDAVYGVLNNLQYSQIGSVQQTVALAITEGIRVAIESLVNDTYTDEEFEKDIGLKP